MREAEHPGTVVPHNRSNPVVAQVEAGKGRDLVGVRVGMLGKPEPSTTLSARLGSRRRQPVGGGAIRLVKSVNTIVVPRWTPAYACVRLRQVSEVGAHSSSHRAMPGLCA